MKRALAILAGVALVCVVAYLSWLNPTPVAFRFAPTRSVEAPLAALIAFAFIIGGMLVLGVVVVQAGRRAITSWRHGRQQRRIERIDDWEERGEQLVWEGQSQQARALLHKAWHRRPEGAHAVLALAASYHDTGDFHRARELLAKAADQHHTNPDVLFALAEAHRAAGERTASVEVLERLRALRPHAPRVLRALRDRYVDGQRWHDAAALQEALLGEIRDAGQQATREREFLTLLRYQASLGLSDPAARVRALEALADSRTDSVPILVSLGDALLAGGREGEASVLWERALRSHPRTVFVERLANMAAEPRHRERLRALLRKLRSDHVQADNIHLLAAQLYLNDGDTEEAARELEALQAQTGCPPLHDRLWAEVHRARGQLEQAVLAYSRAAAGSTAYRCRVCERATDQWTGYCLQCGQWDSYRSDVEIGVG